METFLTVGEVAKKVNCPIWQVQYLLRARDIKPIGRAGVLRLFAPGVVDRLRNELDAIQERRESRCTA
jgi:hypothetical protein